MSENLLQEHAKWIDLIKTQKDLFVKGTERGDIPPMVIPERNGEILAVVFAPEIDKELGYQAASMCNAGFSPDFLTVVFDSHVSSQSKVEGQTLEEAEKEFAKKFPPGSMQKMCDEEGACDLGVITDCLSCFKINKNGDVIFATLPYSYHGKADGRPFQWLPEKNMIINDKISDKQISGTIVRTLREIMKDGSIFEVFPELKKMGFEDEERNLFHSSRAMISLLNATNFIVIDFVSGKHPEWINCKEIARETISDMIEAKILKIGIIGPFTKIIEEHIEKKSFIAEAKKLFEANLEMLNPKVAEDIEGFLHKFQSVCFTPKEIKIPSPPKCCSSGKECTC